MNIIHANKKLTNTFAVIKKRKQKASDRDKLLLLKALEIIELKNTGPKVNVPLERCGSSLNQTEGKGG